MRFKKKYIPGFLLGVSILIIDITVFLDSKWFAPIAILSLTVGWIQVWLDFFLENKRQKEVEAHFLDFVRNLAGAIKSGMPVSHAIIHVSKVDYGALTPYVMKLGHQVEWSIPVHRALLLFGNSTRNDVIKRTIATVIEAEQSGGNMEDVLESITASLIEIKKVKEERRASIHSQVIQSYIIFFIFIGVMLVIQNLLLPYLLGTGEGGGMFAGLSSGSQSSGNALGTSSFMLTPTPQNGPTVTRDVEIKFDSLTSFVITLSRWFSSLSGVFVMLTLIQGFFAGAIIGKLSEGDISAGLKHSLALMTVALFVMSVFRPAV